ncbi:hypothetical protein DAMA08_044240 [Martiniozyma asiatica (nom. inval.)]|nr:hypothetical protein DAMA08_044240 [Martiniozyma asiatica]
MDRRQSYHVHGQHAPLQHYTQSHQQQHSQSQSHQQQQSQSQSQYQPQSQLQSQSQSLQQPPLPHMAHQYPQLMYYPTYLPSGNQPPPGSIVPVGLAPAQGPIPVQGPVPGPGYMQVRVQPPTALPHLQHQHQYQHQSQHQSQHSQQQHIEGMTGHLYTTQQAHAAPITNQMIIHPMPLAANVPLSGSTKNPKKIVNKKGQRKVSAFISKLYMMLHDPTLNHLIWWSRTSLSDSFTFAISPGSEFSQCLSIHFKHGNVASFVRQLHMYGFHKVCDGNNQNLVGTSTDNLTSLQSNLNSRSNSRSNTIWEFRHNHGQFQRGEETRLHLIKRRTSNKKNLPGGVQVELELPNELPVPFPDSESGAVPVQVPVPVPVPMPMTISTSMERSRSDSIRKEREFREPSLKRLHSPSTSSPASFRQGEFQQPAQSHVHPPYSHSNPQTHPNQRQGAVTPQEFSPRPYSPLYLQRPGSGSGVEYHKPAMPASYAPQFTSENVFLNNPQRTVRLPSVFIDPCAPHPNEPISTQAQAQAQTQAQAHIHSFSTPQQATHIVRHHSSTGTTERNTGIAKNREATSLPHLPALASSGTSVQARGKSASIATSSSTPTQTPKLTTAKTTSTTVSTQPPASLSTKAITNTQAASHLMNQMRPSIFSLGSQSNLNSSISTQGSIFSNKLSISSTHSHGSIGSLSGKSGSLLWRASNIGNLLNDSHHLPPPPLSSTPSFSTLPSLPPFSASEMKVGPGSGFGGSFSLPPYSLQPQRPPSQPQRPSSRLQYEQQSASTSCESVVEDGKARAESEAESKHKQQMPVAVTEHHLESQTHNAKTTAHVDIA